MSQNGSDYQCIVGIRSCSPYTRPECRSLQSSDGARITLVIMGGEWTGFHSEKFGGAKGLHAKSAPLENFWTLVPLRSLQVHFQTICSFQMTWWDDHISGADKTLNEFLSDAVNKKWLVLAILAWQRSLGMETSHWKFVQTKTAN